MRLFSSISNSWKWVAFMFTESKSHDQLMPCCFVVKLISVHHTDVFFHGSFSLCCRLSVMSSWLGSLCDSSALIQTAPGHVQAVAAVIWHAKETDSESIVGQHFSEELFRCAAVELFQWEKVEN